MSLIVFTRQRCKLRAPTAPYSPRGRLFHASIHHSASRRARTFSDASALWRQFQAGHQAKGWIDVGYTFGIDDKGRLYEGRPVTALTAAVGDNNTGQIAFCFFGNYMNDRLTSEQRRTLKILFNEGLPAYGVPPLKKLNVRGHQEYAGHNSNLCPGTHLMRHLRWRRGR